MSTGFCFSTHSDTSSNYEYGTTANNGNVLKQVITVPTIGTATGFTATQHYQYDQLNRLTGAQEVNGTSTEWQTTMPPSPFWQQMFSYDRFGNRAVVTASTTSTMIGPNPQINATNNRISPRSGEYYEFDNAGNMTKGQGGETLDYDAENKLVRYQGGAVQSGGADYSYDGDGRRIKKATPSEALIFVYNIAGQLVAEYTTSTPQNNGTSYLTSDTLGTPRVITKTDGSVRARHDYLPFGEELYASAGNRTTGQKFDESWSITDKTRQKFTLKERDNETGLDYFGARYYGSTQGRFTSADDFLNDTHITDPASWNLYAYVRNNPLRYIDPFGEEVYNTNLTPDQQQQLLDDLKKKTGYKNIYFDKDNKLVIDTNAGFEGGSGKARDQLSAAVDSQAIRLNLEAVDTTDVSFAQTTGVTGTHVDSTTGATRTDYTVKIDFEDFKRIGGDQEARDAFSVGLVVLHEFDHRIYNEIDYPNDLTNPGPVETKYINPIRKELGLPERVHYKSRAIESASLQRQYANKGHQIKFTQNGKDKIIRWRIDLVGEVKD